MKDLKGYFWLVLSILFFVVGITTLYQTRPDIGFGYNDNSPIFFVGGVIISLILFAVSFGCFSEYWFTYKCATHIIGVIPERMASSRFPGKPLAKINGVPMVEHVWKAAKQCKALEEVYVCSPDTEIIKYMDSLGARIVCTKQHTRASDQVAEAVERLESFGHNTDVIVMIQGDEPMITPEMIDKAIQPLLNGYTTVSNLKARIKTDKEFKDRNTIKVVTDRKGNALYFSRQPIPDNNSLIRFKQVCIISFTRDALFKFTSLPQTSLEQSESVDMMRLVENGIKVKMVFTDTETHSVDVPEDIKIVERMMKK